MKELFVLALLFGIAVVLPMLKDSVKRTAIELRMFLWRPLSHFWDFYEELPSLLFISALLAVLLYFLGALL